MLRKFGQIVKDLSVIFLGCALYAVAFHRFFRSNGFVMGGFTGIGQILNRLFPSLPVGTVVLLLNVPLVLIAVRRSGFSLLWRSIFAIAVNSLLIDSMAAQVYFTPMEDLPAFLCGGILMGFSLGLLLRKNATTGGTELLARLLKEQYRHLSIGKLCLIIDVGIISAYTLVFREPDNAVYGVIAMVIATRVMDLVIYGSVNAKLAVIISDHSTQIAQTLNNMALGATVLEGTGAWTNASKQVILCVFKSRHIAAIKAAAHRLDPKVFFIICDARDVLGEGFSAYSEEPL